MYPALHIAQLAYALKSCTRYKKIKILKMKLLKCILKKEVYASVRNFPPPRVSQQRLTCASSVIMHCEDDAKIPVFVLALELLFKK